MKGQIPSYHTRHVLGIKDMSLENIQALLDRAMFYADRLEVEPRYKSGAWHGSCVANLFFEASTRTRLSFERAALRLGCDVLNFDTHASSLKKGETFLDTLHTINAMRPDAMVIRTDLAGHLADLANLFRAAIINAGDGINEHPTQALLDILTIKRRFKTTDGLKIVICGDIKHSRVARSNVYLLHKLGLNPVLVAPQELSEHTNWPDGITCTENFDEAIRQADVVMMLRIQAERIDKNLASDHDTYFKRYGLNAKRLHLAAPHAIVMHPGPLNRGTEITADVADHPKHSVILDQVRNGIPTRMACLEAVLENVR